MLWKILDPVRNPGKLFKFITLFGSEDGSCAAIGPDADEIKSEIQHRTGAENLKTNYC